MLGNAALPPFERWSMTAPRYLQYLSNLLHVHSTMEHAIAAALAEGQARFSGASSLSAVHYSFPIARWHSVSQGPC